MKTILTLTLVFISIANFAIESNRKTVNDIYLRSWAEGILPFSSADSSALYDIAVLDALLGGDAVYSARVMLGIDPAQNNNRLMFEEQNNTLTELNNTSFGNIYPNPNDGSMSFDYELAQEKNGELVIYDAIGQKVNSYNLEEGINSLSISEAALQNGIYFYEIKINGEIIESKKIVIIK